MDTFGSLLREWRTRRNVSQMTLALDANVSSKHISFLETGRSQPSREMILKLAQVLDIPMASRNALLTLGGFSEAYRRKDINTDELKPVRQALSRILTVQEPYPAFVLDWDWNLLMVNQSMKRLLNLLKHVQQPFEPSQNLIDLLFSPRGFRPFIANFDEVAEQVILRLRREQAYYQDRQSDTLMRVHETWGYAVRSERFAEDSMGPTMNLVLQLGDQQLSLFSTLATFGTAIDITVQELIIEQYFPADEATEQFFQSSDQTT